MPSVTVGATAIPLTEDLSVPGQRIPAPQGIQIIAHPDNEGLVYVGFSDDVTAGDDPDFDGIPLAAGAAYLVPPAMIPETALTADAIYVIGSEADQVVNWFPIPNITIEVAP